MISLSDALLTNEEVPWRAQSKDYYCAFWLDGLDSEISEDEFKKRMRLVHHVSFYSI